MRFRLDITLPELLKDAQETELEQALWDALRAAVANVTGTEFETVFSRLDAPLSLSASPAVSQEDLDYAKEIGADDDLLVVWPLEEKPANAILVSQPYLNDGQPSFARGEVAAEPVLRQVQDGERPARVALQNGVPLRDLLLMEAAGLAIPPAALVQIYGLKGQPVEPA